MHTLAPLQGFSVNVFKFWTSTSVAVVDFSAMNAFLMRAWLESQQQVRLTYGRLLCNAFAKVSSSQLACKVALWSQLSRAF